MSPPSEEQPGPVFVLDDAEGQRIAERLLANLRELRNGRLCAWSTTMLALGALTTKERAREVLEAMRERGIVEPASHLWVITAAGLVARVGAGPS